MNLIACVDDRMGMMFHGRRQSRDRAVAADIRQMCGGTKLWIAPESEKLFGEECDGIHIAEDFFTKAGQGEYCFVETWPEKLTAEFCGKSVEQVILYRWNRAYPADRHFPLDLGGWKLEKTEEFAGTSHDKITKEIYRR